MAYTQADLDALDRAMVQGAKSVTIDGRRVEYHSLADTMQLRQRIIDELARAAGTPTAPRQYRLATTKGL